MKKGIIFLVLVFGVLAFTNPDMEEFQSHIQAGINGQMDEDDKLGKLLSRPISWLVKESCERDDYLICSVYTIGEENNFVYLGIFDRFIQLKKSDSIELNIQSGESSD